MIQAAPCDVIQIDPESPRERILWIDRERGMVIFIDIDSSSAIPFTRALDEIEELLENGTAAIIDDPWLRPFPDDSSLPEK